MERLSTVYFPGGKITMLPENWIAAFSLDAGAYRPSISIYFDVDGEFNVGEPTCKIEAINIPVGLDKTTKGTDSDGIRISEEQNGKKHHGTFKHGLFPRRQNHHATQKLVAALSKYRVRAAAVCWRTGFRHEGNMRRIWF